MLLNAFENVAANTKLDSHVPKNHHRTKPESFIKRYPSVDRGIEVYNVGIDNSQAAGVLLQINVNADVYGTLF